MKKIGFKILSLMLIFVILSSFVQLFVVKNEVYALSSTYTQYIKSGIANFPESYQKKLAYLKYLHPNWEFKAYYTGIDWEELVSTSAENAEMKNTIHKGKLLDPTCLCRCGTMGDYGYYDASNYMVRHHLDPRNFLGEAMIFQFLDLANGTGVTRDTVVSATKGTFLEPYADDIMTAAKEAGINPLHIVATIFQEVGRDGKSDSISGKVKGYEGYYNYYNYGATDGAGAILRGLETAKKYGWNSPSVAIIDGAKKALSSGYLNAGQTTKYFYKFDVVGNEILTEAMGKKTYNSSYFFGNQYMTNVRDPSSQAGALYDIYAENGILDSQLVFTIPVYNNMPAAVCDVPSSLTTGNLYFVNSLKKYGVEFRTGPGTSYPSLGNLYKGTKVDAISSSKGWAYVKICAATTFNSTTKQWEYEYKTGYVDSSYFMKVGYDNIPDYRSQVDMGNSTVETPTVQVPSEFKAEGTNIKMTPTVKLQMIKDTYASVTLKNSKGVVVTDNNYSIATGDVLTINGKNFTCVKLGDTSGDGLVKSNDYVFIKNYIMDSKNNPLTGAFKEAADVNKDGQVKSNDYVLIKNYIMTGAKISI